MRRLNRVLWVLCLAGFAEGGVEFARPFGEHMVLPHGVPCPVWGRADANEEVRVCFGKQVERTRSDAKGEWKVVLRPLAPASAPGELSAESGGERVVLGDVLVGEVWLASGQSNMDFPLAKAVGGRAEAAEAGRFPSLRLMNLTSLSAGSGAFGAKEFSRLTPEGNFQGSWQVASEKSASGMSAIAWWVVKSVHLRRGIPVGVVENAVGGSGAEAWLPREVMESSGDYHGFLGPQWLEDARVGSWVRGRAKQNLGGNADAAHPYRPGFLFESGVRWWSGFPFSGVLWYQGESNADIADDAWNERVIVDLVTGWRKVLNQPRLPFYMVQLPRIGGKDPLRARWPEFREVQARAAKRLPDTKLIVTRDLGWDSPDVHPPDKRPVADRLADAVLSGRK